MGVRILHDFDSHIACMCCSTSDWAFGPLFTDTPTHDADIRLEAFLRWLDSPECPWLAFQQSALGRGRRDARLLTESGLKAAYSAWLAQESEQMAREQAAEQKESVE